MDASSAARAWRDHLQRLQSLRGAQALLAWDQQTGMPPAGAAARAGQQALLGELAHSWAIDPEARKLLDVLEASDEATHQRMALVARREVDRAVKVPSALVRRLSEAHSAAFGAWATAKQDDDFSAFAPHLRTVVDLALEELGHIDPDRHPYDVALEAYDPGTTIATLRPLFGRLKDGLVELLDAIADQEPIAHVPLPADVKAQRALNVEISEALGYDFGAGRLDVAPHPFTIDIARQDVRITTMFDPDDMLVALGGTIHEVGHALYEQGLPTGALEHTGLDRAASMGLHESQSRFWENAIGRSEAFCAWMAPKARAHLGPDAPDARTLFQQSNRVDRSLIRVFADEVTYNLHIIVRFELELALLEGTLAVEDLPEAWNSAYADVLQVDVPDDRRGCLQDVHWSHGSFGYFPSYTLGNLYAASFTKAIEAAHPTLWDDVADGRFAPVLHWLRHHVHQQGRTQDAPDLVRAVCGDRDPVADLLDHLWGRHGAMYGARR